MDGQLFALICNIKEQKTCQYFDGIEKNHIATTTARDGIYLLFSCYILLYCGFCTLSSLV